MALKLTPEMLAHCYDYLCCQQPFCKWNLPSSDDGLKFLVIKSADRYAHYQMVNGVHHIAVSTRFVGRHETLLSTVAHEIIHLHIRLSRIKTRTAHGRVFNAFRDEICRIHDFDRLTF